MCDDDYYEPDPYEEELKKQYMEVKDKFIQSYVIEPINHPSFHLLKDVFKRLEGIPFEPTSLRKDFIYECVYDIHDLKFKKKFLTEIFLYQFKGLNLSRKPKDFLRKLYEKRSLWSFKINI